MCLFVNAYTKIIQGIVADSIKTMQGNYSQVKMLPVRLGNTCF